MLRINLLPSYVSERRLTRKFIIGFSALFVICLLIPLFLYMQAQQAKTTWLAKASDAEAGQAKTNGLRQQASDTRGQIAPLTAKVDYVKAVHQHNNDLVAFWDTVSRYSKSKVVYNDASVNGTVLTIKAYSPSIAEVGRYLQAMYQEPDIQTIGIDRIPGYPEAVVNKYYLGNRLIAVGSSSGSSGPGGGYPGGGAKSMPGGGGFGGGAGFGGGYPGGGAGFGGGYPGGGGGASGASHPAYGTPAPVGLESASSHVVTIGGGGQSGANGGAQVDTQELTTAIEAMPEFQNLDKNPFASPQSRYETAMHFIKKMMKEIKVRREPQGFPITVTAQLKQPLGVPTLPGTPGAGGAGGAGGYPGAMPGGYPGMMPGGYPGAMMPPGETAPPGAPPA